MVCTENFGDFFGNGEDPQQKKRLWEDMIFRKVKRRLLLEVNPETQTS